MDEDFGLRPRRVGVLGGHVGAVAALADCVHDSVDEEAEQDCGDSEEPEGEEDAVAVDDGGRGYVGGAEDGYDILADMRAALQAQVAEDVDHVLLDGRAGKRLDVAEEAYDVLMNG